ncbi:MAG TPA: FAD-dependent oxidoreductase [Gemmatimonadaceae bacterium]|nr:FAD-dependent oxidoreductase [Gemmatimonadaceae bacterium]
MGVGETANVLDFAIIGAGCAGSYAAWRLANAPESELTEHLGGESRAASIRLFESSGRVGGRLLTIKVPGSSHLAELGGMRFTSNQLLFRGLIQKIGERERSFDFETSFMYLRGRRLPSSIMSSGVCEACKGPTGFPYLLSDGEPYDPIRLAKLAILSGLLDITFDHPSGAVTKANQESAREKLRSLSSADGDRDLRLDRLNRLFLSAREWAAVKRTGRIDNKPLYELGFWNLLQKYLSNEGFLLVHDALGYESILANWNAADAIPWFLSDFGVDYLTVDSGMARIPRALVASFSGESGDAFCDRHSLKTVERVSADDRPALQLSFDSGQSVVARNVILALPKYALKQLEFKITSNSSMAAFHERLEDVTAHPLFKLFLGYERAWWERAEALGKPSGRTTTDLPIRQVYYFERPPEQPSVRRIVMASYSDEHYVDFWRPLHKRASKPIYRSVDNLSADEEDNLEAFGASHAMAESAHRQIAQLSPAVQDIPEPYVALVKDWTEAPFGGGWHSWNVHVKSWESIEALVQPFGDVNLFVCGEAYSSEQGWVEGALKSAELVLDKLGISPPAWIDQAEYSRLHCIDYRDYIRD